MIKPEDLRLGNIILVDNEKHHPKLKDIPMIVKTISRNWSMDKITENYQYKYYCELDKLEPKKYDIDNYSQFLGFLKPIEINPDWLIKFKFEMSYQNKKAQIGCLILLEGVDRWRLYWQFGDNQIFLDRKLKFIHELQNIFKELTTYELSL
jgi:hypothetical protein